jgi:hypothetical protein
MVAAWWIESDQRDVRKLTAMFPGKRIRVRDPGDKRTAGGQG